jgi:transposase InsO family protein
LKVSQSWFYKWRRGDVSVRRARRRALTETVNFLFRKNEGRAGSPRITDDLRDMGWRVSKNTVAAIMAERGLRARPRRRRKGTTRADRSARKAPDLLHRHFAPPAEPDRTWVGDLTEIPTGEGRLYLACVIDLFSRRVVGFALGPRHDPDLARAALHVAVAVRGGNVAGVVFHTDQGGEYTGQVFRDACRRAGVTQSMGRTGSALDNAVAESFNSTLEFELLADHHFPSRAEARRAVAGWIDEYNQTRRHSTAGRMPPVVYERTHTPPRAA